MFNRFIGVSKPAPVAEAPKPVDLSGLQGHASRLGTREDNEYKKIQEIDAKICDLKAKMQSSSGSTYQMYRRQAGQLLRQRKLHENNLRNINNMQMTVDMTLNTVDNMQMLTEQLNVMQQVTDAQSAAFKSIDLNKFYELNDKMQDMREDMDDLNEMMADSMAIDTTLDEEELDAELAQFQASALPMNPISQPAAAQPTAAQPASVFPITDDLTNQLNSL